MEQLLFRQHDEFVRVQLTLYPVTILRPIRDGRRWFGEVLDKSSFHCRLGRMYMYAVCEDKDILQFVTTWAGISVYMAASHTHTHMLVGHS